MSSSDQDNATEGEPMDVSGSDSDTEDEMRTRFPLNEQDMNLKEERRKKAV